MNYDEIFERMLDGESITEYGGEMKSYDQIILRTLRDLKTLRYN